MEYQISVCTLHDDLLSVRINDEEIVILPEEESIDKENIEDLVKKVVKYMEDKK